MSKALRSMEPAEQSRAIKRRLAQADKGLGYWSAVDAKNLIAKRAAKKAAKAAKK